MATDVATAQAAKGYSTEDLAEYQRRVAKLRGLMREHGLDAIVLSDYRVAADGNPGEYAGTPQYARYLSGFHLVWGTVYPLKSAVVIVPLSGELTLVLPPGHLGGSANLARAQSWIPNVVSTYSQDAGWGVRTRWGTNATLASDMAGALRAAGLERGRIGVSGSWAGFAETKADLPNARFESTLVKDADGGRPKDLLEPLIGSNSSWEIRKLEKAQAVLEIVMRSFFDHARAGATIRETALQARTAGLLAGAEEVLMSGSSSVRPWAWWLWHDAPVGARFEKSALYSIEFARCVVDGYTVQSVRSFVVGPPNRAQMQLHDTMKRSFETMVERIEPGLTGEQLFDIGVEPVKKAGLEPWTRFGHFMGYEFNGPGRLQILTGNRFRVHEQQVVTVHPAVVDKAADYVGIMGDTILVEKDRWRFLSAEPPRYEPVIV